MACFVLVHGAFHGGWCWSRVAAILRRDGHDVFTPTQTGLGERRHLLSADIKLDTFVTDICEVLETEELTDVVLVGHSFGGISITGAADRMPERIRRLVYLDSRILENGESMLDVDPQRSGAWTRAAEAHGGLALSPPDPAYFGLTDPADLQWVQRRLTPHPLGTFTSALHLRHPVGNGILCTYVPCVDPLYAPLQVCREWARGRPGWDEQPIATGHDAMVSAPEELAGILTRIAA